MKFLDVKAQVATGTTTAFPQSALATPEDTTSPMNTEAESSSFQVSAPL
jgi:hypothetical protein